MPRAADHQLGRLDQGPRDGGEPLDAVLAQAEDREPNPGGNGWPIMRDGVARASPDAEGRKILLLGGTAEASMLARLLAGDGRFAPVLSLAGRTRAPAPSPIARRIGGFGGVPGLVAFLRANRIAALIDATHPFARHMPHHARAAAVEAGIPSLRIARPAWTSGPGDRWIVVDSLDQAAGTLGPIPRRVFLTIGRQELAPFVAAAHHRYLIRSVDPVDALPAGSEAIAARGPFALADEISLLAAHRIEVVVTKNAGGDATRAKLDAARALGLPVVMVARPTPPPGESVPDAAAAHAWLVAGHAAWRGV
jgi:precorrin-6A/cobalt-precorrin-6A reductase